VSEPFITRCQCRRGCGVWVLLDRDDAGELDDDLRVVVFPGHARPDDRLCLARPGYVIAESASGGRR
jgi:hypothetical protein